MVSQTQRHVIFNKLLATLRDSDFTLVQAINFLQSCIHVLIDMAPTEDRTLFRNYVCDALSLVHAKEGLNPEMATQLRQHDFELIDKLKVDAIPRVLSS